MSNLEETFKNFKKATCPEDIFGTLGGTANEITVLLKKRYNFFARLTHPDKNRDNLKMAEECFKLLSEWLEKAEKRIKAGMYGQRKKEAKIVLTSNAGSYELHTLFRQGDLADIYLGEDISAKIVRNPKNNDLLINEYNNLKTIEANDKWFMKERLPHVLNSLELRVGGANRRANLFSFHSGFYTLEEVYKKYPKGVHPRHAVWMFNRMMESLVAAHKTNIVHGAVVPSNFIIHPESHRGVFIDWCYSTRQGTKIKALVPQYKNWYPSEVFRKESYFCTDTYMAAKMVIKLLGGVPESNLIPESVPKELAGFLRFCTFGAYSKREQDVTQLWQDFAQVSKNIFGKPKFVEFKM